MGQLETLGPELAVLTATARAALRPADAAQIAAAFDAGVDAQRLIALARSHRLVPLLHRHVIGGGVRLPARASAELDRLATRNAQLMLRRAAEVVAIVQQCTAQGLPVVPLKGPLLAQQVYGSPAMRQAGDLDLLCGHRDVRGVLDVLASRGYGLERRTTADLEAVAERDLHHVTVACEATGIRLELHHLLLRPRGRQRFTLDTLRPFLTTTTLMGTTVSTFDDASLVAYLCEHGAGHTWGRLEWLATIAELFRRQPPLDGGPFAHQLGATGRVAAARLLAGELLGVDPDGNSPAAPRLQRANRVVIDRLRTDPGRVTETPFERLRYLLLTDAGVMARIRRLVTMVMAPSIVDQGSVPLPRWLRPLHWALRPLRLIRRELRRD